MGSAECVEPVHQLRVVELLDGAHRLLDCLVFYDTATLGPPVRSHLICMRIQTTQRERESACVCVQAL